MSAITAIDMLRIPGDLEGPILYLMDTVHAEAKCFICHWCLQYSLKHNSFISDSDVEKNLDDDFTDDLTITCQVRSVFVL